MLFVDHTIFGISFENPCEKNTKDTTYKAKTHPKHFQKTC
jgi:hypothetical protein